MKKSLIGFFFLSIVLSAVVCVEANGDEYGFPWPYIQYRHHENPEQRNYRAWISVTKNNELVFHLNSIKILDPNNAELSFSEQFPWEGHYYNYSCPGGVCSTREQYLFGYSLTFEDDLDEGVYKVVIETAEGQEVTKDIEFPGTLPLPFIRSATMQAKIENGDLLLQWENPVGEANWNSVTHLVVVLLDEEKEYLLTINLPNTAQSVTVPYDVLSEAESLHDGKFTYWFIQTRVNDAHGMNYARGESNGKEFVRDALNIGGYLQYRTFEDPQRNNFRYYMFVTQNGLPVEENHIQSMEISRDGNEIPTVNTGYWDSRYYHYNCFSAECITTGPLTDKGFFGTFSQDLTAGAYEIRVEATDGETAETEMVFPGKLALPAVSSSSMSSRYANGDLTLTWRNPVNQHNWDKVDFLRIVIEDESGLDRIHVTLSKERETSTIPGNLLANAKAIDGTRLQNWSVQTRALANNMNYARGVSNPLDLAAEKGQDSDDDKDSSSGCFISNMVKQK